MLDKLDKLRNIDGVEGDARIFRMINCIISFKEEIYLYLYKASHVNLRMG